MAPFLHFFHQSGESRSFIHGIMETDSFVLQAAYGYDSINIGNGVPASVFEAFLR